MNDEIMKKRLDLAEDGSVLLSRPVVHTPVITMAKINELLLELLIHKI